MGSLTTTWSSWNLDSASAKLLCGFEYSNVSPPFDDTDAYQLPVKRTVFPLLATLGELTVVCTPCVHACLRVFRRMKVNAESPDAADASASDAVVACEKLPSSRIGGFTGLDDAGRMGPSGKRSAGARARPPRSDAGVAGGAAFPSLSPAVPSRAGQINATSSRTAKPVPMRVRTLVMRAYLPHPRRSKRANSVPCDGTS